MPMPRLCAVLLLVLLAGCASAPYGVHYADEYGGAEYYYDSYTPAYIAYPAYYSVLWPVYSQWYDPFYAPGFYYGVTFFPSYYNHWGWSGWGNRLAWSPWRSAWWDSYHDWYYWSLRSPAWYAQRQHLGSAHNRQVARAMLSDQPRRGTADIPRTQRGVTGAAARAGAVSGTLPSSRYSPQSRRQAVPPRGSRAISRPDPASSTTPANRRPAPAHGAPLPRPPQPARRTRAVPASPPTPVSAPPAASRPARTSTTPSRASRSAPARSRRDR